MKLKRNNNWKTKTKTKNKSKRKSHCFVIACDLLNCDSREGPTSSSLYGLAVWFSGNALISINEVTRRLDRLVLGWVTGPEGGSTPDAGKIYLRI